MSFNQAMLYSWDNFNKLCDVLKPFGDLFIRFWVAKAFFLSGLVKIQSWSTTLLLFQFEYHIPLLNTAVAAGLSTSIELGMSTLLLLGVGGRVPALVLFIFNIIAVISYSFLWTQAGYVDLKDHICWGLLLLILVLHGPGKLSLDYLLVKWYKYKKS